MTALAPQGPGPSLAPVVINEFNYDDNGTDDLEFVELWNRMPVPVDISGWQLRGEEGDLSGTANGTFTFPGGPGSMTTVIGPGQYLLVSQPLVPNHNPLYVMPATMMENGGAPAAVGSDGLTLRDDLGNVVDGVTWEHAGWTAPVPAWLEGTGLQGAWILNGPPLLDGVTPQRWIDGFDSNNNGADFLAMAWTPGAANGAFNLLPIPITLDFDGMPGSTTTGYFSSSFVALTTRDPALPIPPTTWALTPSPQGGNVASLHDASGGGNSHISLNQVGINYLVECYVYVAGGNPTFPSSEKDAWAIGVGTTDFYAHPPDVTGTYYPGLLCSIGNGPGATGIAWVGYNTTNQTDIYLVDMNDGGPGFTILAGPITATQAVNNGWQRLRIRASGNDIVANFGGNFGFDDGQRFTATVPPRNFGHVYLQYRECILTNANMRPLVIDHLEIYGTVDSSVTFAGTPSPTTVGLPNITTSGGLPSVGNLAFSIDATGMIPFGLSLLAVDGGNLLPGLPVPGAPPTLLLYAAPTFLFTVFNSQQGTSALAVPIPPANVLIGTLLAAQFFDFDPALGVALPFGSSRGCQILVGNG
ncbi:MAG TPA: lamin tail domain-containing protein [Planctomycetota bacterium]